MPLAASGEAVGLSWGEMGNSEVGHLNLGAGRIVYQDFTRINKAIADGKKDEAKKWLGMYVNGLIQARDQFPKWEAEVDMGANRYYGKKPMAQIDSMIDQMIGVAKELGVTVSRPS